MEKKISNFFSLLHPPVTHECPQKNSAQSVQPFGRLYIYYINKIRTSCFIILNIKIERYQCLESDTDEESVIPLSKAKKARKRKVPERLNDSWSGSDSDPGPARLVFSTFCYRQCLGSKV